MSRGIRFGLVAAVAAVLACVPACGKKSGKIKIGVVTNCTAEFWSICEAGAKKAAAEHDVDLVFRQPTNMSVPDQMEIVDGFLQQGVKGLAVSVIDPKEQTKDLKRIGEKTPLLAMDNDAPDSGRLCYIGIDNYEGGKAAGRLVKKALPNGGVVAVFIGSTASANGKARSQGVLDELADQKDATGRTDKLAERPNLDGKFFGKYFVVQGGPITDDGKINIATDKATDTLGKVKGLKDLCMVGLYAYNPPAILEGIKTNSMTGQVKVIGFDEDWDTLKGIAAGTIEATVVQDPFGYGYKSVEVLAAVARGDKPKVMKDAIPYRVVTKDGGPEETAGALKVQNLKVADFEAKLRADLASAKK